MLSKISFAICGFVLSFIIFVTIRFVTFQQPQDTHFHANFEIYINGNKIDLSKDKYMEPVFSCSVNEQKDKQPSERVHMHLNNGGLIHIHDQHVTWGDFFSNIGYSVSQSNIVDDSNNIYKADGDNKLVYILNGVKSDSIATLYINSEDKLLIYYGKQSDSEIINTIYAQVPNDAQVANLGHDPSSCTGNTSKKIDFWEQLKKSVIN